ncbi:MAG: hypothetical protein AUG49_19795 [Catenulispora sp. 13_1_20CM_3_70_7]|nr:MAG: hypothetical protein AUG49_19795 [Catenulispora sp. 13_1_20CM_3_70_7]
MSNEAPFRPGTEPGPLVLFLGVARPGEYETLLEAGWPLGLVRDTDSEFARHAPGGFQVIEEVPFSAGVDAVCRRVAGLARRWRIRAMPVLFEGHVEMGLAVSRRLGLPGPDLADPAAVRDKTVMRRRFADRLGTASTRLYGSLFVTPCHTAAELTTAFHTLSRLVPQHEVATSGEVLLQVEEYLQGTNHSVDVLVRDGRAWPTPVVDVLTGMDLGSPDFQHFARVCPSALPPQAQAEARELAARAVRAVNLDTGVAHVELIYGPTGPRLVELAARPGANRHHLLHLAHGIDLMRGYVDVVSGAEPDLRPTRHMAAAVLTPFPARAGVLRRFVGLDTVRALPTVQRVTPRVEPGGRVGTPRDGNLPPLSIVLHGDEPRLRQDLGLLCRLREDLFEVEPAPREPSVDRDPAALSAREAQ